MHADHPIRLRLLAGLLLTFAVTSNAAAQTVFKCVDEGRHITYQDRPCGPRQRSESIRIEAAPPREAGAPTERPAKPAARSVRTPARVPRAEPVAQSYECRSASGAVFYRHGRCPASIPRARKGPRGESGNDRVESTRMPRSEACRRLRSTAREGSAHDETVSTYERNLGRDPCRRH